MKRKGKKGGCKLFDILGIAIVAVVVSYFAGGAGVVEKGAEKLQELACKAECA